MADIKSIQDDIQAYVRIGLMGASPEVQRRAKTIAESIATLSAADIDTLTGLIRTDIKDAPVHAAYLRYQLNTLKKDKKIEDEQARIIEVLDQLLADLKGPTLNALSKEVNEGFGSPPVKMNALDASKIVESIGNWLNKKNSVGEDFKDPTLSDPARLHGIITAAMDELDTRKLMDILALKPSSNEAQNDALKWAQDRARLLVYKGGEKRPGEALSYFKEAYIDGTKLTENFPELEKLTEPQKTIIRDKLIAAAQARLKANESLQNPLELDAAFISSQRAEIIKQLKAGLEAPKLAAAVVDGEAAPQAPKPVQTIREFLVGETLTANTDSEADKAKRAAATVALNSLGPEVLGKPNIAGSINLIATGTGKSKTLSYVYSPVPEVAQMIADYAKTTKTAELATKAAALTASINALTQAQRATLVANVASLNTVQAGLLSAALAEADKVAKTPRSDALTGAINTAGAPYTTLMQNIQKLPANATGQELNAQIQSWFKDTPATVALFSPTPALIPASEPNRTAMLTAAMEKLNTGQLLAVQASLTGKTDKDSNDILQQTAVLLSGVRKAASDAAKTFKDAVIKDIPDYALLPSDVRSKIEENALRIGGAKADEKDGIAAIGVQDFINSQRTALVAQAKADLRAKEARTNHDFLASELLSGDAARVTAARAALADDSPIKGDLGKEYRPYQLTQDAKGVYAYNPKAIPVVDQLLKDLKEFGDNTNVDSNTAELTAAAAKFKDRIAKLSADELTELSDGLETKDQNTKQYILGPVHAAALQAALLPTEEEKKTPETVNRLQAATDALTPALTTLKGTNYTKLLASAKTLSEKSNLNGAVLAAEAAKWLDEPLGKLDAKDPNRTAMLTSAMEQFNTGQLMAIQKQLKDLQEAHVKLPAFAAALSQQQQAILERTTAVLQSEARKAQAAAIEIFQKAVEATPGYNQLKPDQKQKLLDAATLAAGTKLATIDGKIDPKTLLDDAFIAQQRDALRKLTEAGLNAPGKPTNREILAAKAMNTDQKQKGDADAALATLKEQAANPILDAPYDGKTLTPNGTSYRLDGAALAGTAALSNEIQQFSRLGVLAPNGSDATAAIKTQAEDLAKKIVQMDVSELAKFNATLSTDLGRNPIHAAYLQTAIAKAQVDKHPDPDELLRLNNALNAAQGPAFHAILGQAAEQSKLTTSALIDNAVNWHKRTDLARDPSVRAQMVTAAMDQLSTGQLYAIQEQLTYEQRNLKQGQVLSQEKRDALMRAETLLKAPARQEDLAKIKKLESDIQATPGFNQLTLEQQRILSDEAIRKAGKQFEGDTRLNIDDAFLAKVRDEMTARVKQGIDGKGPTVREFLVSQIMTQPSDSEALAEVKASLAGFEADPTAKKVLDQRYDVNRFNLAPAKATDNYFPVAQLSKDYETFSKLDTANEDPAEVRKQAVALADRIKKLNPVQAQELVTSVGDTLKNPILAAELSANLPSQTEPHPAYAQLNQLKRTLGDKIPEDYARMFAETQALAKNKRSHPDTLIEAVTGLPATGKDPIAAEVRSQMTKAALNNLTTSQLKAMQARLAIEQTGLPAGTTLSAEKTMILEQITSLAASAARKVDAEKIAKITTDLMAEPGFSALEPSKKTVISNQLALRVAQQASTGGVDSLNEAFIAQQRAVITAQLADGKVKGQIAGAAVQPKTNRDHLIALSQDKDQATKAKALDALSTIDSKQLDAPYQPGAIQIRGDKYVHVSQTLDQNGLTQKITELAAANAAVADIQTKAADLASALRDHPALVPVAAGEIANKIKNPLQAAYLYAELKRLDSAYGVAGLSKEEQALRAQLDEAQGPRLKSVMESAATASKDATITTDQLIANAQNWLQGKDAAGNALQQPSVRTYPDNQQITLAAMDQLTTAQLMAIKAKINTAQGAELTNDKITIRDQVTALLARPDRVAQKQAIEAAITDAALNTTFPGLTEADKGAMKDKVTREAGIYLAGGPNRTLTDPAFVKLFEEDQKRIKQQAVEAFIKANPLPDIAGLSSEQRATLADNIKKAAEAAIAKGEPLTDIVKTQRAAMAAALIKDTPTVQAYLQSRLIDPSTPDNERTAATNALTGDKKLADDVLAKPYNKDRFGLTGEGAYGNIYPQRAPNDRGGRMGDLAVGLGVLTQVEQDKASIAYNKAILNETLKAAGVNIDDPSLANLKTLIDTDASIKDIKERLPRELAGIQNLVSTDKPVNWKQIVDGVANKVPVGPFLDRQLDDAKKFPSVTVGGRLITARDVIGYQQGADWLYKASQGVVGATLALDKPAPLHPAQLPEQALGIAAAIVQQAKAQLGDAADTSKAMEAAGKLATIAQLESIARMKLKPQEYGEAIGRLETEVKSMPGYAEYAALFASKDADAIAASQEIAKAKADQRDILLSDAKKKIDLLLDQNKITPAQAAANRALLADITDRTTLTDAQLKLRNELFNQMPALKDTSLIPDGKFKGKSLREVYANVINTTLTTATGDDDTKRKAVGEQVLTITQSMLENKESKTRFDFLMAQQAAAIARGDTNAALSISKQLYDEKGKMILPDADKAAPFPFSYNADTKQFEIKPADIQKRVDTELGTSIPTLSAYAAARAGVTPALQTQGFTDLTAADSAFNTQLAAQKAAIIAATKEGKTTLDALTHAMLTGDAKQIAAAKAQYETLKGDAAALQALPNIFKMKDGKLELDAGGKPIIDPTLAKAALDRKDVTLSPALSAALTAEAAKVTAVVDAPKTLELNDTSVAYLARDFAKKYPALDQTNIKDGPYKATYEAIKDALTKSQPQNAEEAAAIAAEEVAKLKTALDGKVKDKKATIRDQLILDSLADNVSQEKAVHIKTALGLGSPTLDAKLDEYPLTYDPAQGYTVPGVIKIDAAAAEAEATAQARLAKAQASVRLLGEIGKLDELLTVSINDNALDDSAMLQKILKPEELALTLKDPKKSVKGIAVKDLEALLKAKGQHLVVTNESAYKLAAAKAKELADLSELARTNPSEETERKIAALRKEIVDGLVTKVEGAAPKVTEADKDAGKKALGSADDAIKAAKLAADKERAAAEAGVKK